MITEKFSKTTSLLLIATFALAMASTVSAAGVGEMDADTGLPAFLSDGTCDTKFCLFRVKRHVQWTALAYKNDFEKLDN